MQSSLWDKIENFDINATSNGNGFSLRLARENNWPYNFTKRAIEEYKKFMYLAATSDFMVSPSRIVDEVWHLHLTYTKSYNDFCMIIGKRIEHNPSDFSDSDIEKYSLAKEKTRIAYEKHFGKQAAEYWKHKSIFDQLDFEKAKYKLRTKVIFVLLAFIIAYYPLFLITKKIIISIDSFHFIISNVILFGVALVGLELYNRQAIKKIMSSLNKDIILFNLTPLEMVYLRSDNLIKVIHGVVNNLIKEKKLRVGADFKLYRVEKNLSSIDYQDPIITYIDNKGTFYPNVLSKVIHRSNYLNIKNSMESLKKYFLKSKIFNKIAIVNILVFASILTFTFLRLTNGIIRDKPIGFLFLLILVILFASLFYFNRLLHFIGKQAIPEYYVSNILTSEKIKESWAWTYFLLADDIFVEEFSPLVKYINSNNGNSSSSTCGSSCGSSCGGGCGGCGGD